MNIFKKIMIAAMLCASFQSFAGSKVFISELASDDGCYEQDDKTMSAIINRANKTPGVSIINKPKRDNESGALLAIIDIDPLPDRGLIFVIEGSLKQCIQYMQRVSVAKDYIESEVKNADAKEDIVDETKKIKSEASNKSGYAVFMIKPSEIDGCVKMPSDSIKLEISAARKKYGNGMQVLADTFYNEKFNIWMAFVVLPGEVGAVLVKGDFEQCKKFAIDIIADHLRGSIARDQ